MAELQPPAATGTLPRAQHHFTVAEIHFFPVGWQSLLNVRKNLQISDNPPSFALEKAVFSLLLGQNFRKFVNFP